MTDISTFSPPLPPTKATLRDELARRRSALSVEDAGACSAAIFGHLSNHPLFTAATTICVYSAIGNEVHTHDIIRQALAQHKRVALPRTLVRERRLALHLVSSLEALRPGPYDILEPPPDAPTLDPAEIELFLVPGLGFDPEGNRIGYGAGYYDSLLPAGAGWRVGLAYSLQVVPRIPVTPADIPMDLLITEAGVIDCRQGRRRADHLRLRNMTFHGYHGAFPHEREQGIRLAVDVDLRLDVQLAGLTDNLAAAIDYPAVYRLIAGILADQPCTLLEALAEHIGRQLLDAYPGVAEVTVAVRKFHPPVGGMLDAFEVEVTRARAAWPIPIR